jgi:hypothetical protein
MRYTFLITHVHGAREWPCSLSRAVKRRTSHRQDCREVAFSAHRAGIAFGSLLTGTFPSWACTRHLREMKDFYSLHGDKGDYAKGVFA